MARIDHVGLLSGGEASWAANKLVFRSTTGTSLRLLFTDTLIEDEDTYRFLIESAANVFDALTPVVRDLAATALSLPTLESGRLEERKAALVNLRQQAMSLVPQLVWIADGRTPWEVYRDERFLGNSLVDPCSKILKRQMARRWLKENCDPTVTTVFLGIHWSERDRHEKAKNRWAADGWAIRSPLCEPPFVAAAEIRPWALAQGLKTQRLYLRGSSHANCGGYCCKAGQAAFRALLLNHPERFEYHARQEQDIRALLGNVSILSDRAGGTAKRPLTLVDFRKRVQAGGECDLFDWGGCGCFSEAS
jgi:hypothetical protein